MINFLFFRPETFLGNSLFILLVAVEVLAIFLIGKIGRKMYGRYECFLKEIFKGLGDGIYLLVVGVVLALSLLPALVLPDAAVAVIASIVEVGCVAVTAIYTAVTNFSED